MILLHTTRTTASPRAPPQPTLVAALLAAFALGAMTEVVNAAPKQGAKGASGQGAVTGSMGGSKHRKHLVTENGVPVCGKGSVPIWHTATGKPHWGCVKAS